MTSNTVTTTRDTTVQTLIDFAPIKVWSMVVTIMGDLCRAPGDALSGQVLGRLLEEMGVTNQTLRVALHRLKRDGWIDAERQGRGSLYRLTDVGRARTEDVRPIIYASAPPTPRPIYLVLGDPTHPAAQFDTTLPDEAITLAPRMALSPVNVPESFTEPLDTRPLPDWMITQIAPEDLLQDYRRLAALLAELHRAPDDPLDAITLRLLAFHHWRRLRLRHGDLPDLALGDWPGGQARREITRLLGLLPRPDLADLSEMCQPSAS